VIPTFSRSTPVLVDSPRKRFPKIEDLPQATWPR
jgi:hypothetical protein